MRTFVLAKTGAIFGRAAWLVRSPGLAPLFSAVDFPVIEGIWLLRPELAERLLETQAEAVEGEE